MGVDPAPLAAGTDRRGGRAVFAAALGLVALLAYLGWRETWFLTDDAFVTFRYISNRRLGFGYVWNGPPFHRVEGYSNFLWMVLLDVVWSVLGISPPDASTVLSLLFGYATLWQTGRIGMELPLPAPMERARRALVVAALVGIVQNRTFLTWLSSGLETSLFTLLVVWWVRLALRFGRRPTAGLLSQSATAAALAALTRPEGLLFVGATAVLASSSVKALGPRRLVVALAPLSLVAVHVVWRRWFYGDWLPNTYYARRVSPWPAAGLRYMASFVLEYALWTWLLTMVVALFRGRRAEGVRRATAICALAIALYVAYDVLVAGGDHFEYRILHPLVPLLFVSLVWAVGRVSSRPLVGGTILAAAVALQAPLPWAHHIATRTLTTRAATRGLIHPIAPLFPAPVRPYVAAFDSLQGWLIDHGVCVRRQEHLVLAQTLAGVCPPRAEGERLRYPGHPVYAADAIGIVSWRLPHVDALDTLGFNDYVTARSPVVANEHRVMAHDRRPPPGYVECLDPNLAVRGGREIVYTARSRELTPARIADCERMVELFADLRTANLLHTEGRPVFGSSADLGAEERGVELGAGWFDRENWSGTSGRWSGPEAGLTLARRADEAALQIDLTCSRPMGKTHGRLEVNGRTVVPLPASDGRHRLVVDLADVPDRLIDVRFVVDNAYVPRELDARRSDPRRLGVFVHEARLLAFVLPDSIEMGALPDRAREIPSGWWKAEAWVDGSAGRWTSAHAILDLGRAHREPALLVEATFDHPAGVTTGRIEVEGGGAGTAFRRPNGRGAIAVSLPGPVGPRLRVHLLFDRPFVPGRDAVSNPDQRELGAFVQSAHLAGAAGDSMPPSELDPAETADGAAELVYGWGPVARPAAGLHGRWTTGDAAALVRAGRRGRVTVDLWPGTGRWARGRIEAGDRARPYIAGPEGATVTLDAGTAGGTLLKVRVVTDRVSPLPPIDHPRAATEGVLVRSIRFEAEPASDRGRDVAPPPTLD